MTLVKPEGDGGILSKVVCEKRHMMIRNEPEENIQLRERGIVRQHQPCYAESIAEGDRSSMTAVTASAVQATSRSVVELVDSGASAALESVTAGGQEGRFVGGDKGETRSLRSDNSPSVLDFTPEHKLCSRSMVSLSTPRKGYSTGVWDFDVESTGSGGTSDDFATDDIDDGDTNVGETDGRRGVVGGDVSNDVELDELSEGEGGEWGRYGYSILGCLVGRSECVFERGLFLSEDGLRIRFALDALGISVLVRRVFT